MSVSGQRSGKAPERSSNFAQTCNLLSKYLKEKRSFGDITLKGLETHQSPTTTMNLLNNLENSSENSRPNSEVDCFTEDGSNNSRKSQATQKNNGEAKMTIFYGGQVLVFNDLPADKAKEVMAFACSNKQGSSVFGNGKANNILPDLNVVSTSTVTDPTQQQRLQPQANGSDLPIARRASLHRFFEKRKDRVAARAPYQVHNPNNLAALASHKPEGSNSWLQSGDQSSKQLQLKLFVQ